MPRNIKTWKRKRREPLYTAINIKVIHIDQSLSLVSELSKFGAGVTKMLFSNFLFLG